MPVDADSTVPTRGFAGLVRHQMHGVVARSMILLSATRENWFWHGFRDGPGHRAGRLVVDHGRDEMARDLCPAIIIGSAAVWQRERDGLFSRAVLTEVVAIRDLQSAELAVRGQERVTKQSADRRRQVRLQSFWDGLRGCRSIRTGSLACLEGCEGVDLG